MNHIKYFNDYLRTLLNETLYMSLGMFQHFWYSFQLKKIPDCRNSKSKSNSTFQNSKQLTFNVFQGGVVVEQNISHWSSLFLEYKISCRKKELFCWYWSVFLRYIFIIPVTNFFLQYHGLLSFLFFISQWG